METEVEVEQSYNEIDDDVTAVEKYNAAVRKARSKRKHNPMPAVSPFAKPLDFSNVPLTSNTPVPKYYCWRCQLDKPDTDFYRRKNGAMFTWCKSCHLKLCNKGKSK